VLLEIPTRGWTSGQRSRRVDFVAITVIFAISCEKVAFDYDLQTLSQGTAIASAVGRELSPVAAGLCSVCACTTCYDAELIVTTLLNVSRKVGNYLESACPTFVVSYKFRS
jgi:hypothetical protein